MRRNLWKICLVALVAFGTFGTTTLGAGTAVAFDQVWFAVGCNNVPPGQSGLWDDSPSGGPIDNEAIFAWLASGGVADQSCLWGSGNVGVNTNQFPDLAVRAAVNDDAILRIQAKAGTNNCIGGVVLGTVLIGGASGGQLDRSHYVSTSAPLAPGNIVSAVCVALTDDPNASPDARTSALIDEIAIQSPAGAGWVETGKGGGDGGGD